MGDCLGILRRISAATLPKSTWPSSACVSRRSCNGMELRPFSAVVHPRLQVNEKGVCFFRGTLLGVGLNRGIRAVVLVVH